MATKEEFQAKYNKTTEGVSWNKVMELAPIEARESEDLIYLNYDVVEEFIDIVKGITEFEKGGLACGKRIAGEEVGWMGARVLHFYDFILCRNASSRPKKSYRAALECFEKVGGVYEAVAPFHTHPKNAPPSIKDLDIISSSRRNFFLVTPDYFIAYTIGHPFTVIFDTGNRARSKPVTKVAEHYNMPEYIRRIRKQLPFRFVDQTQLLMKPYEILF